MSPFVPSKTQQHHVFSILSSSGRNRQRHTFNASPVVSQWSCDRPLALTLAHVYLARQIRPLTSHWRSTAKESFTDEVLLGRPAELPPLQRMDMPQVAPVASEEEEVPDANVLELARKHALKASPSKNRPESRKNKSLMRPRPNLNPRPESREGQSLLRGTHRGGVMGTSQASRQIPGYSGFIAHTDANEHAIAHGYGKDTRASMKETLFDCYTKVMPGYTGFQPDSVHNVRTFDVQLVTTYGAGNHSMVETNRGLKRPEAGGESVMWGVH